MVLDGGEVPEVRPAAAERGGWVPRRDDAELHGVRRRVAHRPRDWLAATVPDVPVAAMLPVSVVLLVAVPLWFYPRSKGIWAAVEFLVLRADPDYRPPVHRDPRAGELE